MLNRNLHLIEPTLTGLSGHEYGYVASLVSANKSFNFDIHIWLGKTASNKDIISKLLNINKHAVIIHKYFIRAIRQIQKFFLYYKFLKNNQTFYVCTSGLIDLVLCDFLSKCFKIFNHIFNRNSTNNNLNKQLAFFHFHQFNKTTNKIQKLTQITTDSKKSFKILATTVNLANIFIDCGFTNVKHIPCPSFSPKKTIEKLQCSFNKILYAGVARSDKGFSLVVDTVIAMQDKYAYLPFVLQISAPSSNRYDAKTLGSLNKLQKIANLNHKIRLYRNALTDQQYQELFFGAICLLVYEQVKYSDKFSGVTLDAFYAGCPVITVDNTWMGDITKRFDAGIVLQQPTITSVSLAILKIKEQYANYHANAKQAAQYLIATHDPKHSLQAVYDYL